MTNQTKLYRKKICKICKISASLFNIGLMVNRLNIAEHFTPLPKPKFEVQGYARFAYFIQYIHILQYSHLQ